MKREMYDKVFFTNIPAFYKINLYNKIAEKTNILVVFHREGNVDRNNDFYNEKRNFDNITLPNKVIKKISSIVHLVFHLKYKEIILGGWDELPPWLIIFLSKKNKNSVVVESSYIESKTTGIKSFFKKIFLSRTSKAYCSGKSNLRLLELLNYKGDKQKTKGVGLYRRIPQPLYQRREKVINFLYVGRLSNEKNLFTLINVFNTLPNLCLNIIGFGPLEIVLKERASSNIIFLGAINNNELSKYYQQNDVFVLPSFSEPWGMVVEEALNNGTPVLVSERVGCVEEIIKNEVNGIVFDPFSEQSLKDAIKRICEINLYNNLRLNISETDPLATENFQVNVYI